MSGAWACASEFIAGIEDRRTNGFGLNSILGVTLGEPVYTPSELARAGLLTLSELDTRAVRRIPNPQRRTWSSSKPDVLLAILELPQVSREEIAAAGFDPSWGEVTATPNRP